MRPLRALGLLVALAASVIAAGCSTKRVLRENAPPDTRVFVSGAVDTVNHRIHIYWFGTDPDGDVAAYAMRWVYPPPETQAPKWDTIRCNPPGRPNDSLFTLTTGPQDASSPVFQIYAIDNLGAADPTPATQAFTVSNLAPTVTLIGALRATDTTYASITVSWSVFDPDGGGPGLHYRVWLDGNEASYDSTAGTTFTVPSARFLQGGVYTSGLRTINVQAVDDGGRPGPVASSTWFVRSPGSVPAVRGRLLVIDDSSLRSSNNVLVDAFYQQQIAAVPGGVLPPESWSTVTLEAQPNTFRTAADFAQTLREFDAVLWYRGFDTSVPDLLKSYQDSLAAYADAGGKVLLEGPYLIEGLNVPGGVDSTFVPTYLASDEMVKCVGGPLRIVTAGWGNAGSALFRTALYPSFPDQPDTLSAIISTPAAQGQPGGLRVFAVRDTHDVALWALVGQMNPSNATEVAIAVRSQRPAGGRLIVFTLPIRVLQPRPASRLLQAVLTTPGSGLLVP